MVVNTSQITLHWQILTVVAAAYMTIDDVAHRGPDREPGSQSHHFARAQGALVTLLHCVHDTLCTQRDAPPKRKHDTSHFPLVVIDLRLFLIVLQVSLSMSSAVYQPVCEMSSQQIRSLLLLFQNVKVMC